MIVNVSSVKSFQRCRLRWYYEYVLNRVPKAGRPALEFGRLLHTVFELHFNGMTMFDAMDKSRAMWIELARQAQTDAEKEVIEDALIELRELEEPILLWTDRFPVEETLEVEAPFQMQHPFAPGVTIVGRPDRMARCFGKLFHFQNRSLDGSRNIGLYLELAKDDMHELLYGLAMREKYPDIPYGGSVFNIVKKLKYRATPTRANPVGKVLRDIDEILVQAAIPILPDRQYQALVDIACIAEEMERTIERAQRGVLPARNRELDGGMYGSSIDPYLPALRTPGELWNDDLYKNRVDPYQEAA